MVIALAAGALIVLAGTASAHAELESTTPSAGQVVRQAPDQVSLHFGEAVQVVPADIRVYDDHLHRVDTGDAGHISGQGGTVGVGLQHGLADGTYTVTWRVISADSHPVAGGFTFSIGAPSTVVGNVAGLTGGYRSVGVALGTARFLGYVGLVLGPGAFALFALWPGAVASRRARRIVTSGFALSLIATLAAFQLEGPYALAQPLSKTFTSEAFHTVHHTHYGTVLTIRLYFIAALAVLYERAMHHRSRLLGALAAAVGIGLAVTFADAGHAAIGATPGYALAADALHVCAMAAWLGGLTLIVTALLPSGTTEDLGRVLPRFSRLALACVAILAATGAYQAIRQVGSWPALTGTVYGKLVIAKIAGLAGIVALGYAARSIVTRRYRRPAPTVGPGALAVDTTPASLAATNRRFRAGLFLEVALAASILAVTSVLVGTVPAKNAYAAPVSRTIITKTLRVDVDVDPAKAGPAEIHVYVYSAVGAVQHVAKITGDLRLPSRDVGPLPVTFTVAGPGHATAVTHFAVPGSWVLDMTIQTSPINATAVSTTIPVR